MSLSDTSLMTDARICWTQKTHRGADWDVWTVDDVYILNAMPEDLEYFVQFDLTLHCGKPSDNIRYYVLCGTVLWDAVSLGAVLWAGEL